MTSGAVNLAKLLPVSSSIPKPPPEFSYLEPAALADKLAALGYPVELGEPLKGGMVSQVHAATRADGTPVVVKYTYDMRSDDPTELYLHSSSAFVDSTILGVLAGKGRPRVPRILATFGQFPVTVLEDLRKSGFHLVHDTVLQGRLPSAETGERLGRDLADMLEALRDAPTMSTMLSPQELFFDRGLELKEACPSSRLFYEMSEQFEHAADRQLIPVDTHIKNVFLDDEGNAAWIDFGFSTYADPQFVLPNFLSHFAIYALAGYLERQATADMLRAVVAGYRESRSVDEAAATRYLALEVLHRWAGKRIVGIDDFETQQLAVLRFGRTLLDRRVEQLEDVWDLLSA